MRVVATGHGEPVSIGEGKLLQANVSKAASQMTELL